MLLDKVLLVGVGALTLADINGDGAGPGVSVISLLISWIFINVAGD